MDDDANFVVLLPKFLLMFDSYNKPMEKGQSYELLIRREGTLLFINVEQINDEFSIMDEHIQIVFVAC